MNQNEKNGCLQKICRYILLFFPLSIMCGVCAAEATVDLVKEGRETIIVVPASSKTDGEITKGAIELSHYIGRITKRQLPIKVEGKGVYLKKGKEGQIVALRDDRTQAGNTLEIHLGKTSRALREIDKNRLERLDRDGFVIKAGSDAVFLVGKNDVATRYASVTFLEEFCGVRWYLPGKFGEDIPKLETLPMPSMDKTYEPAYLQRWFSGLNPGWRNRNEIRQWQTRMKLRGRIKYSHNMGNVFNAAKYAKKYPDVFPLVAGKRQIPAPGSSSGWQPCFSNPKAVDIAVEYAKEYFAKYPEEQSISLGINDGNTNYCECDNCMKDVNLSAPMGERRSVQYYRFVNAVAKRFDAVLPDKMIGFLAYGQVATIPENIKLNPRLVPFLCDRCHKLIDPKEVTKFNERLTYVSQHAKQFGFHDLFYGNEVTMPRMQIHQAKYYLEHGYKMGARYIKTEAYPNWGLDGFKYWMYARLMWDPSLSVDDMLDEIFLRFFKEAAEPMREYFRIVEKYTVNPIYMSPTRMANFAYKQADQFMTFPPEAVEECEPLLEKAQKMARTPIVRERVNYFRNAFTVTKIMTLRYHYSKQAFDCLQKPETVPEGIALLAKIQDKSLDVKDYYKRVLDADKYCVRYPVPSEFAGLSRCLAKVSSSLSDKVVDKLRLSGKQSITQDKLHKTVAETFKAFCASISDPQLLETAQKSLLPSVNKIMLCDKAPAPKIDGQLDDKCWNNAPVYSNFYELGSGFPAPQRTEVRVVHDGERLYVAVRCYQDTKEMLVWTQNRDQRVYYEDGIEFLLNKPDDTDAKDRLHIIFNTRGNIYDEYKGASAWDGDIERKVTVDKDYYTIEFSVLLKEADFDINKDRFAKINFVRNFYGYDRQKWRGIRPEISNWFTSVDNNVDVKGRGWIIFNK